MDFNQVNFRDEYYKITKNIEAIDSIRGLADLEKINENSLLNNNLKSTIGNLKKVSIPLINSEKHEIYWLNDLKSLFEKGKEEGIISNIVIHGSYGDYSYTNFSDLDITLILKEDVFRGIDEIKYTQKWVLEKIYPFLFKVDPLQHHGPFYLWPTLIKNYSENILPLDVYKYSWGFEEQDLDFIVIDNSKNIQRNLNLSRITCQALINKEVNFFSRGYSMYSVKRYLSNLMILPAFYFTDIHKPVHKKESFLLFKEKYKNSQEIIDISTHLRNIWPETPEMLGLMRSWLFKLGGRAKSQSILQQLYKHKSINKVVKKELIPKVDDFCHFFMKNSA